VAKKCDDFFEKGAVTWAKSRFNILDFISPNMLMVRKSSKFTVMRSIIVSKYQLLIFHILVTVLQILRVATARLDYFIDFKKAIVIKIQPNSNGCAISRGRENSDDGILNLHYSRFSRETSSYSLNVILNIHRATGAMAYGQEK
jgi:hypothetical protein